MRWLDGITDSMDMSCVCFFFLAVKELVYLTVSVPWKFMDMGVVQTEDCLYIFYIDPERLEEMTAE